MHVTSMLIFNKVNKIVICEKNITSEVTVFSVQECVIKKCLTNHFAYTLYFPLNITNP